ncbi:MAG TPA: glycosyltransferase family 4 protein [Methylomirabilota bacterium]
MRVLFTLDPYTTAGGGSVSFARVLAEALPAEGARVTFDPRAAVDAVLAFAQHATPALLARHRRRGARVVHRLDERLDAAESWRRRLKHRRIARLNAAADLTVFQSEFVRANVGPICRAPASRVIHNGVDGRVFRPEGDRVALEGAPTALHVSWSVGASKRLDRIGELLAAGPAGLRVYCAGRHVESGQPWLGDPRVVVLGPRDRDAIAALMRSADFLFFPSELEPCPNTPIEAMAVGLPCLYHPSGGTPELLGDAGVALGPRLADDLRRLLAERGRLRERALARAAQFTAARAAARYAAAIRDAIDMPAGRPPPRLRTLWNLLGI